MAAGGSVAAAATRNLHGPFWLACKLLTTERGSNWMVAGGSAAAAATRDLHGPFWPACKLLTT
eukprot:1147329-Pelagomonas_calceolata.AAC.2